MKLSNRFQCSLMYVSYTVYIRVYVRINPEERAILRILFNLRNMKLILFILSCVAENTALDDIALSDSKIYFNNDI